MIDASDLSQMLKPGPFEQQFDVQFRKKAHPIKRFIGMLIAFIPATMVATILLAILIGIGISLLGGGGIPDPAEQEIVMSFDSPLIGIAITLGYVVIVIVYLVLARIICGLRPRNLGVHGGKAGLSQYAAGAAAGLAAMALVSLYCVVAGGVTFTLRPFSEQSIWLLGALVMFVFQGAFEELLVRGLIYGVFVRRYHVLGAALISSLVFAVLHVGNDNMTVLAFINLTLYGVSMAWLLHRSCSLMAACAFHSMWNFAQGLIFGFPVSGIASLSQSSVLTCSLSSSNLINGGAFGPEGGLATTLVLVVLIVGITLFVKRGAHGEELVACELVELPGREPTAPTTPNVS